MIRRLLLFVTFSCASLCAQTFPTADLFIDAENSSNGTTVTNALLNSGTHGGNGTWGGASCTRMVYDSAGQILPILPAPTTVSPTTYSGRGSFGIRYNADSTGECQLLYSYTPVSTTQVSFAFDLSLNSTLIGDPTGAYDLGLEFGSGGNFVLVNVTNAQIELEDQRGGVNHNSGKFSVSAATPYHIEGQINTSPSTGTVNTTNSALGSCTSDCVSWVSGKLFDSGAGGWTGTITINGSNFTIGTVFSTTLMSVTTAPGTQTGVSYSTNQANDVLNIYDQTNTLIATLLSGTFTSTFNPTFFLLGSAGDTPQANGATWDVDNLAVNYTTGNLPVTEYAASCSGSSPTWTTTPDQTSVQSCLNSASTGDTVNVAGGIANWASRPTITSKNLIVKGVGAPTPFGIVSTSGTAVTWVAGPQFNTGWVGQMTINGSAFTVSSCASTTSCTLTTSAGTLTNVSYSTDQAGTQIWTSSLSADTCNNPCRFTGFGWNFGSADNYMQITESQGFEVDDSTFDAIPANFSVLTYGPSGNANNGLFTNLATTDGQIVVFGEATGTGGQHVWANPLSIGTPLAVYTENSVWSNTSSGAQLAATECNIGGKYVTRFNFLTSSRVSTHGTQVDQQLGCASSEIYNNTLVAGANPPFRPFFIRGGVNYVFHNTSDDNFSNNILNIDGPRLNEDGSGGIQAQIPNWQFCDGTNQSTYNNGSGNTTYPSPKNPIVDAQGTGGYYCLTQIGRGPFTSSWNFTGSPPSEPLLPNYFWKNTQPTEIPTVLSCASSGDTLCTNQSTNLILLNRDYYTFNASFTGATGIGQGTFASMPVGCTPSVGYWATDQGNWNLSGNGAGQGAFYSCQAVNGVNQWIVNYVPYEFPNPLLTQNSAPTIVPGTGTYSSTQTPTLTCATSATCCYTTDNSVPTGNGGGTCVHGTSIASGSTITVSSTQIVNVVGTKSGKSDSTVTSAAFQISGGSTPSGAPTPGAWFAMVRP